MEAEAKPGGTSLSIAQRLVGASLVTCAGLVCAGYVASVGVAQVKVGGSIYEGIVHDKDLLADVLPPPEYIIEAYLVVLELRAARDGQERSALIGRGKQLQQEFLERSAYWQSNIPNGELASLLKASAEPARRFFETRDRELIPALQAGDTLRADAALTTLRTIYQEHRAAIDRVVKTATASATKREGQAEQDVTAWSRWLLALLVGVALMGLVLNLTVAAQIASILRALEAEFSRLARCVRDGQLLERGRPNAVGTDFASVIGRVNTIIDAFTGPLSVISDYLRRMAAGDIPPRLK